MKETLFLETDKNLSNVGRVVVQGKDNLGLELYVKEPYWHTEEPTEDGQYLTLIEWNKYFKEIPSCPNRDYRVSVYEQGEWLCFGMQVLAWHKIPPYKEQK